MVADRRREETARWFRIEAVTNCLRLSALALLAAAAAPAQYREVRVEFDSGGCISCAESVKGRLARVRGVEEVELDLERSVVSLRLADDNRVRLLPLVSRIGQGGAKVLKVCIVADGKVERGVAGPTFRVEGVGEVFQFEGEAPAAGEVVRIEAEADAEEKVLRVGRECG